MYINMDYDYSCYNFTPYTFKDVVPVIRQIKKNKCAICFEEIPQKIALDPCGHATMCSKCIDGLKHKICPICMRSYDKYIKIYD